MIYQTLRANVWDEVKRNLDGDAFDPLYQKISDAVDAASSWREQIALAVTSYENAEILRIIEDEDLNTD